MTVLDQSFGSQTTLNFGAIGDPPICHNSTSRPKKLNRSSVISLSQSNAARCSSVNPIGNPDDGHRLQARGIGEQLPQVRVVGALQLVLDQHPIITCRVLAEDVGPETARRSFSWASNSNSRPMVPPSKAKLSSSASQGVKSPASLIHTFRKSTGSKRPRFCSLVAISFCLSASKVICTVPSNSGPKAASHGLFRLLAIARGKLFLQQLPMLLQFRCRCGKPEFLAMLALH